MVVFLGLIGLFVAFAILCLVVHYKSRNECCWNQTNMVAIHMKDGTELINCPIVIKIEKCIVCNTEWAYKINEYGKAEIPLDYAKSILKVK
jgi:hypothetical protein